MVARFVPYPAGKTVPIANVLGQVDELKTPGYAVFTLNGTEVRLDPVLEDDGREGAVLHLQGPDVGEGHLPGGTVPVHAAAEGRHGGAGLQQGLQPALRVHRLRDLPATAARRTACRSRSKPARRSPRRCTSGGNSPRGELRVFVRIDRHERRQTPECRTDVSAVGGVRVRQLAGTVPRRRSSVPPARDRPRPAHAHAATERKGAEASPGVRRTGGGMRPIVASGLVAGFGALAIASASCDAACPPCPPTIALYITVTGNTRAP